MDSTFSHLAQLAVQGCEPKEVIEALKRFNVCEAIDVLVSDQSSCASLANLSYMHSNGFYKLVVHRQLEATVRLHYWPLVDGESSICTTVHTHRWTLYSRVLAGTVENTTYEREIGKGAFMLGNEYTSNGRREFLTPTNKERLGVTDVGLYEKGASYHVPFGSIHSSKVVTPALTLVITTEEQAETTTVFSYQDTIEQRKYTRQEISKFDYVELLNNCSRNFIS